ncbi:MAG: hypothetical protein ACE5D8_05070 [Fidelibacterota bacterium]
MNWKNVKPIWFILMCTTLVLAGDRSQVRIGGSVTVPRYNEVENVVAVGGDAKVYGTAYGDVVAVGGDVYLGPDARIHGDCVSVGGTIHLSDGAMVYGELVEVDDFNISALMSRTFNKREFFHRGRGFHYLPGLAFMVLGIIVMLLLPNQAQPVMRTLEMEPGKAFLSGLAGVFLFVPTMVLLAISLLGLPFIPLFIITSLLLLFFGYFSVAALLGKKLLQNASTGSQSYVLQLILGLVLLWLVGLIPMVGSVVRYLLYVLGWGAVLMVLAMRLSNRRKPVLPPKMDATE